MASTSRKTAATKSTLTPSKTLKGHGEWIPSISYFPDGKRMISGSVDKTTRQWDLKTGKEIEEARVVWKEMVAAVAVSRDGQWAVTGGGKLDSELKACETETGIVKTFRGHSKGIICIDISANNTLLAGGSWDKTARIWNLETGKLVAGPFKSIGAMGAVRFSPDSKKLAVKLELGTCLEVWDVQTQKLDVRLGNVGPTPPVSPIPVFWTNKNKTIITALLFTADSESIAKLGRDDDPLAPSTIYEFDASMLETVGPPFQEHTKRVSGLALSFDDALLVSASGDNTIKLWAFESRQLLASFNVQNIDILVLSPDSRQLAYTVIDNKDKGNQKICICDTPVDILAQARNIARKKSNLNHLLHSHATRPPPGYRRPPISAIPIVQRPPPTRDPRQAAFFRLSKLLHFSPRANRSVPVRRIQPCDPLDVPATLPLPSSLSGQAAARFDHFELSSPPPPSSGGAQSLRQHLSFVPRRSHGPPVVDVAADRKFTRLAAAKLPEYNKVGDTRHPSSQQATVPQENDTADIDSLPDVHWCTAFLCYYSCWSHGRLRIPPRWRLERVDIPRQDGTTSGSRSGAQGSS